MSSYPYAPPPPPPPPSSAPSTAQYGAYSQSSPYGGQHRGGHSSMGAGGRGRGHHQGSGHDYNNTSRYHSQHHDYTPSPPNGGHYNTPSHGAQWQGSQLPNRYPPTPNMTPHAPQYPPSYDPQAYPQMSQGYHPQYSNPSSRPPHGSPYSPHPNEPPPQRWGDSSQGYSSYSNRGGRGGYHGDRGGHMKSDPSARSGYDQMHPPSAYGAPYQPNVHPQSATYPPPPYSYPPAPDASYPPPPHVSHNSSGYGTRGRDGFNHSHRGSRGGHGGRGEKFRHRDQKPHHQGNNHAHKNDAAVHSKKKKRKTNTLGLTPGDDSSDGEAQLEDEEERLAKLLGADVPVIEDMAKWVAERKANYPTKARIEARKAAEAAAAAKAAEENAAKASVAKLDKEQAKIDKLEKKLSKLKGSIEKRKRAANDEGDEMRADNSSSSSDSSDDEPEVQSSSKPIPSFLPPPPVTRADPSNHCKYYSTGGTCGKKGKCRFKHDPAVREAALQERTKNGGRMTLKQRLLLNDKEHDDMDLVRAVVDMRTSGRLPEPAKPVQQSASVDSQEQATKPSTLSTLPGAAGIASLPPHPFAAKKA
ncbi:hypothetical protein F5Y16DRAFT_365352 [Xylariaceae sp. FL0255]|nr:hypothetical protein F5Y16DRAFT_365352 [Xylariaceae sp. FL0255]